MSETKRPPFRCVCGHATFRVTASVSGSATVCVEDDGNDDLNIIDTDWDSDDVILEDVGGPFKCCKCGKEYDNIPPDEPDPAAPERPGWPQERHDSELSIFAEAGAANA